MNNSFKSLLHKIFLLADLKIMMLNQCDFGLILTINCFYLFFQAVQEFTDLCKNSTVDAVESALPFWPRLFNKLAMVRSLHK